MFQMVAKCFLFFFTEPWTHTFLLKTGSSAFQDTTASGMAWRTERQQLTSSACVQVSSQAKKRGFAKEALCACVCVAVCVCVSFVFRVF